MASALRTAYRNLECLSLFIIVITDYYYSFIIKAGIIQNFNKYTMYRYIID